MFFGTEKCQLPMATPGVLPGRPGSTAALTLPATVDLLGSCRLAQAAVTTWIMAALPTPINWITSAWPIEPTFGGAHFFISAIYWSSAALPSGLLMVTV